MSQKEINNHKNRNKSALPGESGGKTKKNTTYKKAKRNSSDKNERL